MMDDRDSEHSVTRMTADSVAFSKTCRPITIDLHEDASQPPMKPDDRETHLKQSVSSVSQGDGAETIMKRLISGSTEQFSGDQCETPLKPPKTDGVFFSGSEDRSLDPNLTPVACPDSKKPSEDTDLKKPINTDVRPKEPNRSCYPYQNALPVMPTKEHDIEIDEKVRLPFHLSADHYDILILNHPKDLQRALNIKKILRKNCILDDGTPVKVLVLGDNDHDFVEITQVVTEMDEASQRCTLCFMLMSANFCEDEFFKMVKDEFLWASVTDLKKKWSVIPLHTKEDTYTTPFGLSSLKGIWIRNDIADVDIDDPKLNVEGLNLQTGFEKSVCPMIKKKVYLRREREADLEKKVAAYRDKVLHERRLQAAVEKAKQIQLQKQREKEIQEAVEKAYQISHQPLPPSTTSPEKPQKQPVFKEPAPTSNYEVHVTQNNYIVPPMDAAANPEEDIEYVRGDPPSE